MADILQGSAVWRVLQAIGLFFRNAAEGSNFFTNLRRAWRHSTTRRLFTAFGEGEDAAARGGLTERFLRRLGRVLSAWKGLRACVENSLLWRLLKGVWNALAGSKLLGWVFSDGVTGLLLTVLGLYAGVDWFLRDVMPVPVLSSTWDELLLIASFGWVVFRRIGRETPAISRTTNLDASVLTFVCVGLALMFTVSPYFSIAVSGYRAVCQYILWFFVVTRLLRDDRDMKRLYGLMVGLALLIAFHGIYQYIVGVPIPDHWTDNAEAAVRTRSFSIFGSPNILADFMVIFAPMAAGIAYSTKNKKLQAAAWFAAICMCLTCLFTMSRAGWVAMAVAVVTFALLVDRRLFLLMLLAGVAAMFMPFVASRLGYIFTDEFAHSTANGGRAARWALGLGHLHRSNPMLGFGLGMFGGAVAMQNKVFHTIQYFYLDNYYLKTMVEMGYVGLGAFIFMQVSLLVSGCRGLYKAHKAKDGSYSLAAGIFSGLCGVLVHCYFENIFEEPYMMATFWILAAVLTYLGIYRNRKA